MLNSIKKLKRPVRLDHSVQQSIKDYIIENKLRPGSALPSELEFARRLGVSRIPVREAVKALEMVGVVEVQHGNGLYVGNFSIDPILDILPYDLLFNLHVLTDMLEVRRALETTMIGEAVDAMQPATITELQGVVDEMLHAAETGASLTPPDRLFHHLLFRDLNNAILLKILDAFWVTQDRSNQMADLEDHQPMVTYQDHKFILEAVQRGDKAAVQKSLYEHYHGIVERIKGSTFFERNIESKPLG